MAKHLPPSRANHGNTEADIWQRALGAKGRAVLFYSISQLPPLYASTSIFILEKRLLHFLVNAYQPFFRARGAIAENARRSVPSSHSHGCPHSSEALGRHRLCQCRHSIGNLVERTAQRMHRSNHYWTPSTRKTGIAAAIRSNADSGASLSTATCGRAPGARCR